MRTRRSAARSRSGTAGWSTRASSASRAGPASRRTPWSERLGDSPAPDLAAGDTEPRGGRARGGSVEHETDERRLLNALTVAVLSTDGAGIIAFANEAATDLFARTTTELLGSHVLDLVALGPGESPVLPDVLRGVRWQGDVVVQRPGGDSLLAAATVNPILDAHGNVVGAI